jgi:hypothetical protein
VTFEALEVLVEHVDEALGRLGELRLVLPGLDRYRMCGSTPGTEVGTAKPK